MIKRSIVDRIRDRAEIVDVVGDFVSLRKHGREYIGLCPFHDDTRPSFHVSPQKNYAKCFACGEGGNPLSFIMKHEHLTYPEAVKYLGRKYGIEVEETEQTEEEKKIQSERQQLLQANAVARDFFVHQIHNEPEGRRIGLSYFKERGLSLETIKEYELGYSPVSYTALYDTVRQGGGSLENYVKSGLLISREDGTYIDRYRDRVIYPIHSISGNVVGFGGRILVKKEHTGKYVNSPASLIYDKSRELYGLYFAKNALSKEDKCLVVEGYMDVLSMHQTGIKNVVASSGTALTPEQVQLIKRYTSNLVLIFDSDAAGIKAALRGLDVGFEKEMSVYVVLLPEGEDPDSFAQHHTKDEVEDYIASHLVDGLWFKESVLRKELGEGVQASADIMEELLSSISHHPNRLTRELYTEALSRQMGVSIQGLTERIQQLRRNLQEERYRARERAHSSTGVSPSGMAEGFTIAKTPEVVTDSNSNSVLKKTTKTPQRYINNYEEILLSYFLNHGNRTIAQVEDGDGSLVDLGSADIILSETRDLRESGMLSDTFCHILDEVADEIKVHVQADLSKLLTWNEDPAILYSSEVVLQKEFELSPLHKSFIDDQKKDEAVTQALMKDIISYKYEYILREIHKILEALHSLTDDDPESNDEKIAHLLEQFEKLTAQKNFLAERIGERVINPSDFLSSGNNRVG